MKMQKIFSLRELKRQVPTLANEAQERAEEFETLRNIAPDFMAKLVV